MSCPKTPFLDGKHGWVWYDRPKNYHCKYGCGAVKSGPAPREPEPFLMTNVNTNGRLHKVANTTPCLISMLLIPFALPKAFMTMVHERYEKKCKPWAHKWTLFRVMRPKGKHAKPEEIATPQFQDRCDACGAVRTRKGKK